jgi:hypothetical protein
MRIFKNGELMMRSFKFQLIIAVAVIALAAIAVAGEKKPWIDMENCDFCKCLTKDPDLLDNMTWEYHDIDNGVLSITTVEPESKEAYLQAQKEMEELAMSMSTGKTQVTMCDHCHNYGKLMMAGARIEMIEAGAGYIMLVTSDDPEVIKMIHEFGQRNREFLASQGKDE